MRIAADAGHGGGATGAYFAGVAEKDITLLTSLALEKILLNMGHEVFLTRGLDSYVSLSDRAALANAWGADIFISLHCNADADDDSAGQPEGRGEEIGVHPADKGGKRLAECLAHPVDQIITEHKFRGIKEANFAVLRLSDMPSALVELAFMDNTTEIKQISTPGAIIKMASLIALGIKDYVEAMK